MRGSRGSQFSGQGPSVLWPCLRRSLTQEDSFPMPGRGRGREGRGERFGSPLPWAGMLPISCAGYTICYYPGAMSQTVSDMDIKLLACSKGTSLLHPPPSVSAGSMGPQTQRAGWGRALPGPGRPRRRGLGAQLPHPTWEGGRYSARAVGRQGVEGTSDFFPPFLELLRISKRTLSPASNTSPAGRPPSFRRW